MYTNERRLRTRQLVFAGVCVAIGLILPQAFHMIPNAGSIFLPMHIPVLLSGFLCGGPFGLVVGLVTPLLSSLLTGMPPAVLLPAMMCELAAYGLVSGLLYRHIRIKRNAIRIYVSLVCAMLIGRVFSGILRALIFNAGEYSVQIWVSAMFVTALPGLVIQLLLIPALVAILQKSGAIQRPVPHLQQDRAVEQARNIIRRQQISCVVIQNDKIAYQADGRGVKPLLYLYENEPEKLENAVVVDKIIGKAAAMILVLGGAKYVYGEVMSAAGLAYLQSKNISTGYGRCVDMISNRTGNGICPIEQSVLDEDDAVQGLGKIKDTVTQLMKNAG